MSVSDTFPFDFRRAVEADAGKGGYMENMNYLLCNIPMHENISRSSREYD